MKSGPGRPRRGDPDDPTVQVHLRLLASERDFLRAQPGGITGFIRRAIDRCVRRAFEADETPTR